MNKWNYSKLENFCDIKGGKRLPKDCDFCASGYPYIRARDINNGKISFDEPVYLNDKLRDRLKRYTVRSDDICITIVGNNVGDSGIVPKFLDRANLTENAVKLSNFRDINSRYLNYYLQTNNVRKLMQIYSSGAAQGKLGIYRVKSIPVLSPPIPIQKKIAAVLSAYDDLIENNNRRIAILEKTAEELYREWFVRMRFPGHETVTFHKGVPEGWAYVPSSNLLKILSGGTPKTDIDTYWNGDIPFFTPKDAPDNFYVIDTEKHITENGLSQCNSALYKKNTIFITARGTVGKIVLAFGDMAMNQSCYALRPKKDSDIYFYFLSLKNSIKYIRGISNFGVFDYIIVDTFKKVPIFLPADNLINKFNGIAKNYFDSVGCLLLKNINLKKTRDLLLSRLISGTLSVENLNIQFPPGMGEQGCLLKS